MSRQIEYEIHPKESFYFIVKVIVSVLLYALMAGMLYNLSSLSLVKGPMVFAFMFYASLIALYILFSLGILVGYLKGNAIKVSRTQFADIYQMVEAQSQVLGLSAVPDVYILQSGGILNGFATRFLGSNYIVLYSEIVDAAYAEDVKMLEFIIGHELGHIKRNHLTKRMLLFPSAFVPFLSSAYSRGCEYTCDSIGNAMSPEGSRNGLLLLVGGQNLFKRINQDEYIMQQHNESGFWHWFAEKVSSHPHLTKRVEKFKEVRLKKTFVPTPEVPTEPIIDISSTVSDYSNYMPK